MTFRLAHHVVPSYVTSLLTLQRQILVSENPVPLFLWSYCFQKQFACTEDLSILVSTICQKKDTSLTGSHKCVLKGGVILYLCCQQLFIFWETSLLPFLGSKLSVSFGITHSLFEEMLSAVFRLQQCVNYDSNKEYSSSKFIAILWCLCGHVFHGFKQKRNKSSHLARFST